VGAFYQFRMDGSSRETTHERAAKELFDWSPGATSRQSRDLPLAIYSAPLALRFNTASIADFTLS
jgi:hypothetical protein